MKNKNKTKKTNITNRPVKDPLFLVGPFSEWHEQTGGKVHLIIVGPEMNDQKEYVKHFHDVIKVIPMVVT